MSSGAASAWRQFNFFSSSPVKDAHDLASPPETFKTISDIATIAPSSQGLLVADIHGSIHLLDNEFEVTKTWIAHESGHVTHLVEKRGILITLIEELGVKYPVLKIWDLEHTDKLTSNPVLLRSAKIQHGSRPHPVSTLALSSGLSHLAIGLADGTVLFMRGLDQYLFSTSNQQPNYLPKPKAIHEASTDSVTGLGFREPYASEDPSTDNLYLFIVTLSQVLSYQVTGRGTGYPPSVVDDLGSNVGCAKMNQKSTDMIIARDEAIYLANTEGRGPSYALEGPKSSILTHKSYIVITSPPFVPTAGSASGTVRRFVDRGGKGNVLPGGTAGDISRVVVFDIENKYIAYSNTFRETVKDVFSCWGHLFVLTNESTLYKLTEAPMSTKLDLIFGKANYALAVSLAHSQGLDEASIADIHRRYGDQYYNAGDHEGAMDQYIKTIGHLQPSYVIRKYLDAQRIQSLAIYLQELHTRGLANADHTTLLLNAYAKMKDVSRLDAFIKAESTAKGKDGQRDLPFDLETVIRVCRQAGYFDHAVYLAKKYDRHEDYLRIQIEDAGRYKEGLDYLRKLGPVESENNLGRYGRVLLSKLPEETTQLLIDICTGSGFQASSESQSQPQPEAEPSRRDTYLSYIPYSRNSVAVPADAASTASTTKDTDKPKDTASGSGSGEPGHRKRPSHGRGNSVYSGSRPPSPPPTAKLKSFVRKPSPRVYFVHFVDHPEHFVRFLEAIALTRWGQKVDAKGVSTVKGFDQKDDVADPEADKTDRQAVWNTLVELYLSLSEMAQLTTEGVGDKASSGVNKDKALAVLKSGVEYDPMHALLVCSTRGFVEGQVMLWEKLGMYEDILRFFIDRENALTASGSDPSKDGGRPSIEVLKYLNRYGATNPQLYPLVLRFLTSTPALLQRHTKDLAGILEHIEEEKILPPLGVVQVLSRNGVASVGLVKEWLMRRISGMKGEIESDRRLIESYRSETAAKLKEVQELADPNTQRVFHVTKCSSCGAPLELPTVHFMCKHSYHQRCLGEHDTECPLCARQHSIIRQLRRDNERLAQQHDVFLAEVDENGFAAIAAAYGQGLLNVPTTGSI